MPNLDQISIRVTNVTSKFSTKVFRLGNKLCSAGTPAFVAAANISHANVHKATYFVHALRRSERDRRLVFGRTAADTNDEGSNDRYDPDTPSETFRVLNHLLCGSIR